MVRQLGKASYYHDRHEGRRTASGEIFDQEKMTAASPDLPMGWHVTVTDRINGRSVEVRINDRGPYHPGRVIDLTEEAAERLGMKQSGVVPVRVEARPSRQPTEALRQAVLKRAMAATASKPSPTTPVPGLIRSAGGETGAAQ